MSMSFGDCNDIQLLVEWIVPQASLRPAIAARPAPTDEQARDALARLADRSSQRLMAGTPGDRVTAAWPSRTVGSPTVECCSSHHAQRPGDPTPSGRPITGDGGVMAACCDPDDCGPCCPACPTCPSIPREGR